MGIEKICSQIVCPSESLAVQAWQHLDSLTKPQGSLGRLEDLAVRLFAISGGRRPLKAEKAIMYTVAADHGVVAEGVTLFPQAVTRQMVVNFLNGGAAVNALCGNAGVDLRVVDAGCAGGAFPEHPLLLARRMGEGTANFVQEPAMTVECCRKALNVGIALAEDAMQAGYDCIGMGEMGIGNSTAATALFCAFLQLSPEKVAGPGAGIPAAGIAHKIDVIRRALERHQHIVATGSALEKLATLGGFEIAVKAGIVLGAAFSRIPIVVDGFISTAAFIAARALCPAVEEYAILSHCSAEPGYRGIVENVKYPPLLDLGLRLGEGTGAVLAIQLLRAAAAIFNTMATFEQAAVSQA